MTRHRPGLTKAAAPALTPWQKIMKAGRAGHGLRLTAEEVHWLAVNPDIQQAAQADDERDRIYGT